MTLRQAITEFPAFAIHEEVRGYHNSLHACVQKLKESRSERERALLNVLTLLNGDATERDAEILLTAFVVHYRFHQIANLNNVRKHERLLKRTADGFVAGLESLRVMKVHRQNSLRKFSDKASSYIDAFKMWEAVARQELRI